MMLENDLAEYTNGITFESLDTETIDLLKRNLLDSYAGICASLQDAEMLGKFDRMSSMLQNQQGINVWGIHRKMNESDALFLNTILGRRSDLVNSYISPNNFGGGHPSDNVSLVLTLADYLGKSGRDVFSSMYAAYMLSCGFANFYAPEESLFDHDVQAVLYTPLVIGFMLGLTSDQMVQVQRIAGSLGLDINQSAVGEVGDWRHCTYASCVMRGLQAVRMAQTGFTGPQEIYEGQAGINRFMRHSQSFWQPVPDLNSIVFKRWPAMTFCQTPIDVALDIAQKIDDHRRITKIHVDTYKKAIDTTVLDSSYHPTSRAGRTHSLPYCTAVALVMKTVEYNYFDDDFLTNNPGIAALIPNVAVTEDKNMNRDFPNSMPCKITVTLDDGSAIDGYREYPQGDPRDPLSDQQIEDKTLSYLTNLVDEEQARGIIHRIWNLENEPDIDWLVDPLKQRLL